MDRHTKEQRSYNMSRIRSKNTTPELIVRRLVHKMGFRYRLHSNNLPGRPDIVLKRHRKIILVHGCFWHGHNCKNGRNMPKTNKEYWIAKREYNTKRDRANMKKLKDADWEVYVIWECQTHDPEKLIRGLEHFLKSEVHS